MAEYAIVATTSTQATSHLERVSEEDAGRSNADLGSIPRGALGQGTSAAGGAQGAYALKLRKKFAVLKESENALDAQLKKIDGAVQVMKQDFVVDKFCATDTSSAKAQLESLRSQINQLTSLTKEPDVRQSRDLEKLHKDLDRTESTLKEIDGLKSQLSELEEAKKQLSQAEQPLQNISPDRHDKNPEGDFMQQQMDFQAQMMQRQQELSSLNQKTALISEQIKAAEAQVMAMINSMLAGVEELTAINKKGNQIATGAI
ncbi:hypothetical protein [Collimonas humicola]|uniref:hypothetical protein n=1 Tax=Collimonas humicola TaxID=2825886 RepID=UPI001B8B55F7|nr:hypothetical protein [Collimonas humicola]